MARLTPNGIEYGDQTGLSQKLPTQTSGWFHYEWVQTSRIDFAGSVTGQTTGTMPLPARAKVFVYTYTPMRGNGDTNDWGGHYEDLQYEINGGSFISVGESGFVSMMQLDAVPISKHTDFCVFDFRGITSDFDLRLRTRHRDYNSAGRINSGTSVGGGSSNPHAPQNAYYKNIIVQGFAQQ